MLFFKILVFTVLVPGMAAVVVPVWVLDHVPPSGSMSSILGGALLSFGAAVYAWCAWDFATFGRGTPAPIDPPKNLVIRGLYRYSRNPMYVGVVTVISGWAVLFRSLDIALYAVAAATCFHLFIVLYEEPKLKRVFGAGYDEYRGRVRRWISW